MEAAWISVATTTQITAIKAYSLRPLNPLPRFANLEWLLT